MLEQSGWNKLQFFQAIHGKPLELHFHFGTSDHWKWFGKLALLTREWA